MPGRTMSSTYVADPVMRRGSSRRRTCPPMKLVVGIGAPSPRFWFPSLRQIQHSGAGRIICLSIARCQVRAQWHRPGVLVTLETSERNNSMAIHSYRYSDWDGSQDVPDFSADDLLENMTDDLLRGGDPERALRNLMRRGFRLPDGRRFEGMQRLLQQMREYRQEAFSRYDPNGIVDRIREQLE